MQGGPDEHTLNATVTLGLRALSACSIGAHAGRMDAPKPEVDDKQPMSGARAWGIASLVAVLLVAVIGVALIATRDDSGGQSSKVSSSTGVASQTPTDGRVTGDWMRGGCAAWAQTVEGAASPSDSWCASMGTWMDANGWGQGSGSGAPMMGSMMSGNAEAMRNACRAWGGATTTTSSTTEWCDQMADWMLSHWGDGDNWMMNG